MIYDLPDNAFRTLDLRLITPQQMSRSGYTGRRQVMSNPWHSRWTLEAEHVTIVGEANMRPWRAFLAKLEGVANRFRFPVTETDQHAGAVVAKVKAGSTQSALTIKALPAGTTYLPSGSFLTVRLTGGEEQLIQLTGDLSGNGAGEAVPGFSPPLRGVPTAESFVETKRPWVVAALDEPEAGYSVGPHQQYGFALRATEAF